MSIPRLAIARPVTMFMISFVVVLLGAISLTRLPVDLMPDVSYPTITVRVGYTGVGPLEMEELVTRPIEQAVSAVAGLDQINSTSSEGNANVRLNFAWGTDLNEAADEVRTRIDRVRGRLPEDADPPTIFKFDSTSMPIMGIGVEGDFDPVTPARARPERPCRRGSSASPASPPSASTAACAARFASTSRARRSPRSTSRSTASCRCCAPRTRTSRSAKSSRPTACSCCAAPASSPTSRRSATWSS